MPNECRCADKPSQLVDRRPHGSIPARSHQQLSPAVGLSGSWFETVSLRPGGAELASQAYSTAQFYVVTARRNSCRACVLCVGAHPGTKSNRQLLIYQQDQHSPWARQGRTWNPSIPARHSVTTQTKSVKRILNPFNGVLSIFTALHGAESCSNCASRRDAPTQSR